jgi:hypothetical protein
MPIGELLGFGARSNPRRGFLLVSKLLGKHWPSRPHAMARLHRCLAEKLVAADLGDSAFLLVGMAETATGLGNGVFESLRDILGPIQSGVALQTTRYRPTADDRQILEFQETHSHHPRLLLPLPPAGPLLEACRFARTLVVFDDEISTGDTVVNSVKAVQAALPNIHRILIVTITDFSGGECAARLANLRGITYSAVVSLLSGRLAFSRSASFDTETSQAAPPPSRHSVAPACSAWQARCDRLDVPEAIVSACLRHIPQNVAPILVVGTGEFMHPAFRLAVELEGHGLECRVQSTTRSPLMVTGDIRSVTQMPDLTGEGVPHFLYNFNRNDYSQVLVVHESTDAGAVNRLCDVLAGRGGCVEVDWLGEIVRPHAGTTDRAAAQCTP